MPRLVCIIAISFLANAENITINFAHYADLAEICAFDRTITYEYFKPFYQRYYAHFELGKNPDPFLEKELAADMHDFKEILYEINNRMLIACDKKQIVGLLLFHKEDTIIELDLLLIHHAYRQQGIGRQLVDKMLAANSNASKCIVYPIRENKPAMQFYEKIGFVNCGIPQINKCNIYGISYADMYWLYELAIL